MEYAWMDEEDEIFADFGDERNSRYIEIYFYVNT